MAYSNFAGLRDDFTDNSLSASAWLSGTGGSATIAETGGQLRMTLPSSTAGTHYAEAYTPVPYNLTSDSVYINIDTMVSTAVAATAYFDLRLTIGTGTANNMLRWRQVSNTVSARHVVGGTDTQVYSATWSATTYKYLRIRADTTTVYWDSSSNGTSWTNRASVAISSLFAITDLFLVVGASCGNVATPGSFRLEDVNLILPALTTTWRWTQALEALTERIAPITLALDTAGTAQAYLVTADGVDASGNPSGNIRYFSGPAGQGRLLTEQATQAAAENMAVNIPTDGRFDLPTLVECKCIRLYHRSVDGNAYTLREFYPRRQIEADDIKAENIQALHIAAGVITADHINATLTVTGKTIQTAYNGARVVLSGADFGGFIGYSATDTYDPAAGTGTYQVLWSLADGKLYAGGGVVTLSDQGIVVTGSTTYLATRAYGFTDGTNRTGDLSSIEGASSHSVKIDAYQVASKDSDITITSDAPTGKVSNINLNTRVNGVIGPQIQLQHAVSAINLNGGDVTVANGSVTIATGLNVGTVTGATAGQILSSADVSFTVSDAGTANSPTVASIHHRTSGTPAASFGVQLSMNADTNGAEDRQAAIIQAVWSTATDASRQARLIFLANDSGGSREAFRIGANGSAATLSFFGAGVQAKATVTGSRGGNAALASLLTALANYGLITDSSSA